MTTRRQAVSLLLAVLGVGCGPAKTPAPPPPLPLETATLSAIAQGPGARWVVTARPRDIAHGPLMAPLSLVVPAAGVDRLSKLVGFEVREAPDALLVGYAGATLYAAHLPTGTSPQGALEAAELRLFPPLGKSTPRPDLVRAWGSTAAGGRASVAAMWSVRGDAIVGESGRLGPVQVAMALATGKLSSARALAKQAPFDALATWAGDAPLAVLGRCPLTELVGKAAGGGDAPVVLDECDGAAMTFRPAPGGKLVIAIRLAGHWGKDAALAAEETRKILEQVSKSDLGQSLALVDASIEVTGGASSVDATIVASATALATGLRKLVESDVADVLGK
jgi:hypothetical protein